MSKIGNIYNSYGNNFSIAVANASSDIVLNAAKLPSNTLIVASPFDVESNKDFGTYSLIITDSEGTPTRLTYCIKEGNGLHNENGVLTLEIDNSTMKEINRKLSIDVESLVDNNTIKYSNGKLSINVSALDKASSSTGGTVKVDGFTIKSDNGLIYVETSKLDLASNDSSGICIGDGTTTKATQGKLSILVSGLEKASSSTYGICKADNDSIMSVDGVLSLKESYFINDMHIGLVKVDGTSIISNNGALSINQSALTKASSTTAGTVMLGNEFFTNANGQVSVTGTSSNIDVSTIQSKIDNINERLDIIEENLANL